MVEIFNNFNYVNHCLQHDLFGKHELDCLFAKYTGEIIDTVGLTLYVGESIEENNELINKIRILNYIDRLLVGKNIKKLYGFILNKGMCKMIMDLHYKYGYIDHNEDVYTEDEEGDVEEDEV